MVSNRHSQSYNFKDEYYLARFSKHPQIIYKFLSLKVSRPTVNMISVENINSYM